MPEPDRTVKCPICDEDFDPTVAGGWCTNPDCGEWQHTDNTATEFDADDGGPSDADLIAEGADDTPSSEGASDAATDVDESTGDADGNEDMSAAEAFSSDTATAERTDETATEGKAEDNAEDIHRTEPAADGDTDQLTETGDDSDSAGNDDEADGVDETGEADEADGAEETDEADKTGESPTSTDEDPETDDEATITCPDCERELDADANFCIDCGADVQDITPGDDGSLDACPSCDTPVDDDASFCVNCGEDLDAHRGESDTPTADSASSPSTTDETAAEPATAGNAVETLASQSDDEPVPDTLVLSVEGRDIAVEDGDRIGREIRAALLDAGRPEDEAVRIHREHVRFDRQPEGFYLVDLGDNPTRLNGTPMQKGDREPVELGDELELSGVVTMTIRAA
ncbi:hypothetical protein Harman_34150 [Haloarcula mannanilytica]|uniref:FHA domain-containing protein n=1 Tax=Haloarcula mannanilytica TaxID=2509225 RepID=A0A4C2EPV1_9EURY|nr:zinc ribbon domain-containing protein [Haloarcula mannanilytica]GCF15480.1 hypothetical protein Harman_34150 [Haloarcula mannanilytica]